jgi:hypothetical protein
MSHRGSEAPAFLVYDEKFGYRGLMTEEDFLKKVGIYSRYLVQFINEGDVPKILDAIEELEKIRKQAEAEKIQ